MRWARGALLALALVAPSGAAPSAQVESVTRFLELDAPVDVAVGDEVLCTARIDIPGDVEPVGEVDFGVAWASEGPLERRGPGGTTFIWTLIPLTAGEVELPLIEFDVGGQPVLFGAPPGEGLSVASPRPADDEGVRPLPAFREPSVDVGLGPRLLPMGIALGLGLLIAGYGALRLVRGGRRHGASVAETPPSAAERLAAMDPSVNTLGAAAALGPLLREILDSAAGQERGALTDDEWLQVALAGSSLSSEECTQVKGIVRSSGEARYGARAPGVFALKDDLNAARAIARRVEGSAAQGGHGGESS